MKLDSIWFSHQYTFILEKARVSSCRRQFYWVICSGGNAEENASTSQVNPGASVRCALLSVSVAVRRPATNSRRTWRDVCLSTVCIWWWSCLEEKFGIDRSEENVGFTQGTQIPQVPVIGWCSESSENTEGQEVSQFERSEETDAKSESSKITKNKWRASIFENSETDEIPIVGWGQRIDTKPEGNLVSKLSRGERTAESKSGLTCG